MALAWRKPVLCLRYILQMVSAGFLLLGKIVVAALSAVICFAILTRVDRYADEVSKNSS